VNYLYAFTTFFPEIRRSTDNSVTFQAGCGAKCFALMAIRGELEQNIENHLLQ